MLDFPNSPSVGQTFTSGGATWTWDGTKWVAAGTTGASSIYLPLTGGTLTGPLTVSAPTSHIDNAIIGATTPAAASVTSLNGGQLAGMRNLINNGDMRIDQRNSGSLVTPTAPGYVIDRWAAIVAQASKWSFGRVASATAGSAYALKSVVASTYTAVAADFFYLSQVIEGLNVAHLNWGTANAKTVTVSGTINASVTGSYAVSLRNGATNRAYVSLVVVSSANTDTPFSVTVPGDTAGTWATDNTAGIYFGLDLGSGSNSNTTAGAWQAGGYTRTSGSVTLTGTSGATVLLKDIQLEAGSVATPFERRLVGTELALCQRYYQRFGGTGANMLQMQTCATAASITFTFAYTFPTMRAAPTITIIGTWTVSNCGQPAVAAGGQLNQTVLFISSNAAGALSALSPANGGFDLSAEL